MKCALAQLKELDGTEGWQWVTLSIYDMGGKHPVYRYGERQAVIASPERLKTKVPNYLAVDQSEYASMCTLPLAVRACDTFGILTPVVPAEEEGGGSGTLDPVCGLPAQLMTTLPVTCNVGCAFVGLMADFYTFIEGVRTHMQDLDALFVVNWEAWRKQWFSGCLLKCVWSPLQIRRPTRLVVRMRHHPLPTPPTKKGKQMHPPHL